ncbi:MAG TPA: hypothetical protein VH277_02925, partial [Gemmatimonadaceae bacterium]|nr:hypothetical protein [Gemmatimonadaceae bacterium]
MSDDANESTTPRGRIIKPAPEARVAGRIGPVSPAELEESTAAPSVRSLIPPQTIDWLTSMVRALLRDAQRDAAPLDVSVTVVEADVSLGEKAGFGAPPVAGGDYRSARPRAYALIPLGPVAESSGLSLSSPSNRGFYLSVDVADKQRWSEQELAGLRLAATLLAREVILRR